jgi:hypothetical protein
MTFIRLTFSRMAPCRMTFGKIPLSKVVFSTITLRRVTFGKMTLTKHAIKQTNVSKLGLSGGDWFCFPFQSGFHGSVDIKLETSLSKEEANGTNLPVSFSSQSQAYTDTKLNTKLA